MWDDKKSCSYLYVMTDSTTDVWGRLPRGQKLEEKKESTTDRHLPPHSRVNCQIKVASTMYSKKISLYFSRYYYEIVIQIFPYKFLTVQRPFAFIPTSSLDLIIYLVHTIDAVVS